MIDSLGQASDNIAMRIRRYSVSDASSVHAIFIDSVHHLCRSDYSFLELEAWAPSDADAMIWAERFADQYSIVAEGDGGAIIGFASADTEKGYIDMLYVASSAAGHGVGKTLLKALEARMGPPFTVYASLTAMPFFVSQGYGIVKENIVVRGGVRIRNCLMKKD